MKRTFHLLLLAVALAAGAASAQQAAPQTAVPTASDPVAHKREMDLASKLRCLVCQNETIAASRADLAVDLRKQVRDQIAAGKSDQDIIDYMTARYGDFVLYEPPLKATTWLLWFGPLVLGLIGLAVAWRVVRARRKLAAEAPLSAAESARAAALLREEGERK
jgi:cytochrome c-type biogenesis protein CcmH